MIFEVAYRSMNHVIIRYEKPYCGEGRGTCLEGGRCRRGGRQRRWQPQPAHSDGRPFGRSVQRLLSIRQSPRFYSSAADNSSSDWRSASLAFRRRSAHTPFNLQYYRRVRSPHWRRPRPATAYAGGTSGAPRRSKPTAAAIWLADAEQRRRCCQRRHRRVDERRPAVDSRAASVGRSPTLSVRPPRCWPTWRSLIITGATWRRARCLVRSFHLESVWILRIVRLSSRFFWCCADLKTSNSNWRCKDLTKWQSLIHQKW